MLLTEFDFDLIDESHLQRLVDVGEREGQFLEFKAAIYGGKDDDTKEFLKDISSLANSAGGYLVIGMTESQGQATGFAPIVEVDLDKQIQRLENLARDGIEPRIIGLSMRAVVCPGGHVLLIRVPRSWTLPHRVSAKKSNRFHLRNSAGAHEASMDELRSLFTQAALLGERLSGFQKLRMDNIICGRTPIPLTPERGLLVIHVLPFVKFSGQQFSVDLRSAQSAQAQFSPIGADLGHSHRLNFEGLLVYRSGPNCHGYTQLFRDGAIEATKIGVCRDHEGNVFVPALPLEQNIVKTVPLYLDGLQKLEVPPPFVVQISLNDIVGTIYGIGGDAWADGLPPRFTLNALTLPDVIIEDFGNHKKYQQALRPSLDTLWNAADRLKSKFFDDEGHWVGKPR